MDRFSRTRKLLIAGTFVVGMGCVAVPSALAEEVSNPDGVTPVEETVPAGSESLDVPTEGASSDSESDTNEVNTPAGSSDENPRPKEASSEAGAGESAPDSGNREPAPRSAVSSDPASTEDSEDKTPDAEQPENQEAKSLVEGELQMRINMELERDLMDPVTAEDLAKLESLDLSGAHAHDWSFLKYAVNLTSLRLGEIGMEDDDEDGHAGGEEHEHGAALDMAWLAGMTKLETLDLTEVELLNASELKSLTNLRYLDVSMTEGFDDSVLASMSQLTYLAISGTGSTSLEGLAGATNLEVLQADNNEIADAAPLSALTKLKELNLSSNKISSVEPLKGLTELTSLKLAQRTDTPEDQKISDSSALAGMTKLTDLDLRNNALTSTAAFKDMTAPLEHLLLSSNQIADNLVGLSHLMTLQSLEVSRNPLITNLDAIKDIPLTQLLVAGCGLVDPEGLLAHKDAFLINAQNQVASHDIKVEPGISAVSVDLPAAKLVTYNLDGLDPELAKDVVLENGSLLIFDGAFNKPIAVNYQFKSDSPRFELSGVYTITALKSAAGPETSEPEKDEDDTTTPEGEGSTPESQDTGVNTDTEGDAPSGGSSPEKSEMVDAAVQTEEPAQAKTDTQAAPAHARELPKTGDAGSVGMLLSGAFASLAGLAALRRRKH